MQVRPDVQEVRIFTAGDRCAQWLFGGSGNKQFDWQPVLPTDLHRQGLDLNSLRAAHPGVTITMFDTNSLLNSALQNPAAYGFTNTTAELIQQGPNAIPSQYLFWDSSHPTTAADTFLANGAYGALVPEPSGLALAGICGLSLLFARSLSRIRRKPSRVLG
jgi:hypothetical protein